MLSKCANPECNQIFRYLHEGKIFRLAPTPSMHAVAVELGPLMTERFWLCEQCAKRFTIVWGGSQSKLVPLPKQPERAMILAFSPGFGTVFSSSLLSERRGVASIVREDR
jgi:hypothetical protein